MNISGLPNPVTPILGLRVHGWVPIAVVENDSVRPRQIDPHTARSCAQNEGKVLAVIIEPTRRTRISFQKQMGPIYTSP